MSAPDNSDEVFSTEERIEINLHMALDTISEDMVQKVFKTLYHQAAEGNLEAIKLWLAYSIGEPQKNVNLEGSDLISGEDDDDGEDWKAGKKDW
jgi:lysine/ornithine N-monooxygenase